MTSDVASTSSISSDYESLISKNERIIYVGQVKYKQPRIENTPENKWKGKWDIEYTCSKEIQLKENGRIYFILADNKIYKIGSSAGKGGIKTTFSFYISGLGGSPSILTMGIHALIQELLDTGKEVKIYVLFNDPIKVVAYGLSSANEVVTYPDVKVMEDACRVDYKKIYGKYPQWNFQENGEEWPAHIKRLYTEQVNKRNKKESVSSAADATDTTNATDTTDTTEGVTETWL